MEYAFLRRTRSPQHHPLSRPASWAREDATLRRSRQPYRERRGIGLALGRPPGGWAHSRGEARRTGGAAVIQAIDLRKLAGLQGPERAFVSLYCSGPAGLASLEGRQRKVRALLRDVPEEAEHYERTCAS